MEFVDPTEDQAAGDEEGDGEADGDGDIDIVPDSDDNVTEPAVQNTDHDLPQTDGEDDNDSDGDELGEEKESTPITRSTHSGKVAPVQLPPKKRGRGRPKILKSAAGPSGVSTKRTAELKVSNPTSDPTKPTKRICRPSKSATVVTVSSGPSPERPPEPATTPVKVLPTGNGDSDFSIRPPPKRESPLLIIRRPQRGKRKAGTASSTVTLTELKALMEGDVGDTTPQAGFSVSTIDESTMKTKSAVLGKKQGKAANVVQEERLSVLQELGSAVKMYKKRIDAGSEENTPKKVDDDVSVWAGQIERKVRRISDPMLQEDLMDHLSYIVKQASRGQWSVNTLKSPTFTVATKAAKSPVTSFLASLPPAPSCRPATSSETFNTQSLTPVRQQVIGQPQMHLQSQDQLAVFAQWINSAGAGNSPGLPQGPQAQPVPQAATMRYPTAAEYANMTTVSNVVSHQRPRPS